MSKIDCAALCLLLAAPGHDPRPAAALPPVSIPAGATTSGGVYNRRDSDATPPVRFQHDTTARIATLSTQGAIDAVCGKPQGQDKIRAACRRGRGGHAVIIVPNPCLPQFRGEDFAWRLCHELGHGEGWGPNHEP